jgi:hypothetical protein
MAYATISDVQARMPQVTLDERSKPSLSSAETFLADAETQVDATLENLGYVVPITGEKSLSIVKGLTISLTIVMILQARAASVGGEAAEASIKRAQGWYDDRVKALADKNNPLELTDAERTTAAAGKPEAVLSGLLVDDDGEEIEPRVTMGMQF